VKAAVNFVEDGVDYIGAGGDCYGHGTMVASIAAGEGTVAAEGRTAAPRHPPGLSSLDGPVRRTRVP
jgi:hypothetical protein